MELMIRVNKYKESFSMLNASYINIALTVSHQNKVGPSEAKYSCIHYSCRKIEPYVVNNTCTWEQKLN